MISVVSPYHLTTREPVALATLLLAQRVVTLMPAPFATMCAEDLRGAAASLPRYRRFVESWRWTEPLWRSGTLCAGIGGADAVEDVRRVCERLATGEHAELLPLMRMGLFEDEREYLEALAGDVLKGGPDPGICVPVSAGLDRFAVRHGLMVARSAPASIAQKAEEAMGRRVFAFSMPVLSQATGETMSDVREDAAEMLAPLRAAVGRAGELVAEDGGGDAIGAQAREIAGAAREIAGELGELMEHAARSCDRDDVRAIAATATVTGLVLPVDAVLRSSGRAARAMLGSAVAGAETTVPVVADPLAGGKFVALVVKIVGR